MLRHIKFTFFLIFSLLVICFTSCSFAQTTLQQRRVNVINQYVVLLGKGDYVAIPKLFSTHAKAISSSGIADNPVHFYKKLFTKTILSPKSDMINIFEGQLKPNEMVALFHFSWKNKQGKIVSAKFLDLIFFKRHTVKIQRLFVFSNTFNSDIMKQLD